MAFLLYRRPVPETRSIMGFSSWLRTWQRSGQRERRRTQTCPRPRAVFRPTLEALEDRWLPSTLTVMITNDSGPDSLRADIAAAHPGDQIVFAKSVHANTLTSGELVINKSLDIEGPGEAKLTMRDSNTSRVFDISGSATNVEIAGLTIADGSATGTTVTGPLGPATLGGGILDEQAHLTLSHVTLANNQAAGFIGGGGGVASVLGASLTVEDSTFTNNRVAGTSVDSPGGPNLTDGGNNLSAQGRADTGNRAI